MPFFDGVKKKEAISWAFFDFANSAYGLLILSFVFPIYFKEVIAAGRYSDLWWGFAVSLSILIGGLAAPVIGSIADYDAKRKKKFIIFSVISMIGTASLYFTGPNMLLFSLFVFIITNIFFEIALTLYDSFLVHVSSEKNIGRISGFGWGLGYIGGIVAMLAFKPLYANGFIGDLEPLYKLTFPLTALFFFIFAMPSFLFVKEHLQIKKEEPFLKIIKIGFKNTLKTLKEIKKHKKIGLFLLGFYLMNDALVTFFSFMPIYARTTLGISISEISLLLLIIQLIGFPSAVFFGWLSDKKGPKKILLSTIIVWCAIVVLAAIAASKPVFYAASMLIGLVIGSSQAVARSWFSKIIPKNRRCEFFGFNGFASKIAATTGPLVFGLVSSVTGNQRIAVFSLLLFFMASFLIFLKIEEPQQKNN